MSGIFGVIDRGKRPEAGPFLDLMAASLCHFPFYKVETHCTPEQRAGIGRIKTGVFNPAPQPVWSQDGCSAIVMSGELYHRGGGRISGSPDAAEQHVLDLYQKNGEQFASHLEGEFVLAIWDTDRQKLVIANDHYGLYPLLYTHNSDRFLFAHEMKAFFCDPHFRAVPDLTALAEYHRFQVLLGEKTFFENVFLLPPATVLTYSYETGEMSVKPYWDFGEINPISKIRFEDAVEEAVRLLQNAVRRRLGGRAGLYLSGGLDARAILGVIPAEERKKMASITYGLPASRDFEYGRQLAKLMGTQHHPVPFVNGNWVREFAGLHLTLTEGFHSWIHLHGINVMSQAREWLDINLTGFSGGELDFEDQQLVNAVDDADFNARLFTLMNEEITWPSINEAEERSLYSPAMARQMRGLAYESLLQEVRKYDHLPYPLRAAAFGRNNVTRRLFQYYTVFNRSHFEQRYPFSDYAYSEFIYALPPEMTFDRRLRKEVLLRLDYKLGMVPYDRDELPILKSRHARLAARIIQKSGQILRWVPFRPTLYADYENWLRNELREWGENILFDEQTRCRNIYEQSFLSSIWRRLQSGREPNIIGKIAPVMTYELMQRMFYDRTVQTT